MAKVPMPRKSGRFDQVGTEVGNCRYNCTMILTIAMQNMPGYIKESECKNIFKNKVKSFLMHEMGVLERDLFIQL